MKKIKVVANIIEDMENNQFTIYPLTGKGGAIVSGTTINEAKEKFTDGTFLVFAVKNLIVFANGGREFENPEIEFVETTP